MDAERELFVAIMAASFGTLFVLFLGFLLGHGYAISRMHQRLQQRRKDQAANEFYDDADWWKTGGSNPYDE